MQQVLRQSILLSLTVASVGLVGCGPPMARLRGTVTLQGKPVPQAEIFFESAESSGSGVSGRTDDNGVYYLNYLSPRGMPAGTYHATITVYMLPKGGPLPPGEEGAALRNDPERVVRQVFRLSNLTIPPGETTLDLELTNAQRVSPH